MLKLLNMSRLTPDFQRRVLREQLRGARTLTQVQLPVDTANALVPHGLTAPLVGAETGPLSRLTFVVKDLYDIAGRSTGESAAIMAATSPVPMHRQWQPRILGASSTSLSDSISDHQAPRSRRQLHRVSVIVQLLSIG